MYCQQLSLAKVWDTVPQILFSHKVTILAAILHFTEDEVLHKNTGLADIKAFATSLLKTLIVQTDLKQDGIWCVFVFPVVQEYKIQSIHFIFFLQLGDNFI